MYSSIRGNQIGSTIREDQLKHGWALSHFFPSHCQWSIGLLASTQRCWKAEWLKLAWKISSWLSFSSFFWLAQNGTGEAVAHLPRRPGGWWLCMTMTQGKALPTLTWRYLAKGHQNSLPVVCTDPSCIDLTDRGLKMYFIPFPAPPLHYPYGTIHGQKSLANSNALHITVQS